jgi:hypothetical protein
MQLTLKIPEKKTLIKIAVVPALVIILFLFWGPRLVLFFQTRFLPFSSGWEAVYMTNGEVYIGKIRGSTANVIKLSDTYLVQVLKQDENNLGGKTNSFKLNGGSNNLTLIKWGFNQPLKSKGELFITRAQMQFWEKLDKDSEVVKQLEQQK